MRLASTVVTSAEPAQFSEAVAAMTPDQKFAMIRNVLKAEETRLEIYGLCSACLGPKGSRPEE